MDSVSEKILLISVKPEFAGAIFDGKKTAELRRVRPKISKGDTVLIYATLPISAVVGGFEVDAVIEDKPEKLWSKVRFRAGVSSKQFRSYFDGASLGFAIIFSKIGFIDPPLDLACLRKAWAGFHPPQGYRYLHTNQIKLLLERKRASYLYSLTPPSPPRRSPGS